MLALDIITDAHRKIGVAAADEPLNADQIESGLRALNRLMHSIQNREPDLFLTASEDVTLYNVAEYSLAHCLPRAVMSARLVRNGGEMKMHRLTRQEYDALPIKDAKGTPTTWYFDRQKSGGTIYVWPVLVSGTATLRITYERGLKDIGTGGSVPFPPEWGEALVYGLAARLADDYGVQPGSVVGRAEEELRLVLARDREGSMYFRDDFGAW